MASRSPAPGFRALLLGTTKRKRRQARGPVQGHHAPIHSFRPDRKPGHTTVQASTIRAARGGFPVRPHTARSPPGLAHRRATPAHLRGFCPARSGDRGHLTAESPVYTRAVSIVLVWRRDAPQYYDAYFSVVPTIGTLFLFSVQSAPASSEPSWSLGPPLGREIRRPDPRAGSARSKSDRGRARS